MKKVTLNLTPAGLKTLLLTFGVDTKNWGTDEANTVEQLLEELNAEESSLQFGADCKLIRVLRAVELVIKDPERGVLLEDYQILPDGRRKEIGHSPGGKISNNETPIDAAYREAEEELGLTAHQCICGSVGKPYTKEKDSKSYPTLRTIYEFHPVNVHLINSVRIEDGYSTVDKADGKKKIFFKWSGKNQNPKP